MFTKIIFKPKNFIHNEFSPKKFSHKKIFTHKIFTPIFFIILKYSIVRLSFVDLRWAQLYVSLVALIFDFRGDKISINIWVGFRPAKYFFEIFSPQLKS